MGRPPLCRFTGSTAKVSPCVTSPLQPTAAYCLLSALCDCPQLTVLSLLLCSVHLSCAVSNTSTAAFSVSAMGSAVIDNSIAVSAYRAAQGKSGTIYFDQPSLFPVLSLSGVRTFVDYTFGSNVTSSNVTLASSDAAVSAFNLGGYINGESGSFEYFHSSSLSGGLQLLSSPAAVVVSGGQLSSSSQLALSQSSLSGGTLLENGSPLTAILGDAMQYSFVVSNEPLYECSLTLPTRTSPPPSVTVVYYSFCMAGNTSAYGAWSVSASGVMLLDNSAAQAVFAAWSSNYSPASNYYDFNAQLFSVLSINGSRTFTEYGDDGDTTTTAANITGLAPLSSQATQTLTADGELYSGGAQFLTSFWNVAPWQAGLSYQLDSQAALPGGAAASSITLSSSMKENGGALVSDIHDSFQSQFDLQPYPQYDGCYLAPQPRTAPPATQISLYWTYCSSYNTTAVGAWSVSASGVLVIDTSAIVALYDTLLGGQSSTQQQLPVLSISGSRTFVDYSTGVPVSSVSNITGLTAGTNSSLNVFAYVYGSGTVSYNVQDVGAAGLSFMLTPNAAMPGGQQTRSITLQPGNVENRLNVTVPYSRGDVQNTQFTAATYPSNYYFNGSSSSACYIPPQPRASPPPSTAALYWTYCSASNSTVNGAWAVSASGVLLVNTSSLIAVYQSMNATSASSYTYTTLSLPIIYINGSRQFTDYSTGAPIASVSNITQLVNNTASTSSAVQVYVVVFSSGQVQFQGSNLGQQGVSMLLSPQAAMPLRQLAGQITVNQTYSGLAENGIAPTGGSQWSANSYPNTYGNYVNGQWVYSSACTQSVPTYAQQPPGPPPATLRVYWQYANRRQHSSAFVRLSMRTPLACPVANRIPIAVLRCVCPC